MIRGSGGSVGLPIPRSITSMPARRFLYLSSLILPKRYGGRFRTRAATSMPKSPLGAGSDPSNGKGLVLAGSDIRGFAWARGAVSSPAAFDFAGFVPVIMANRPPASQTDRAAYPGN